LPTTPPPQTNTLATELASKLPAAALASLIASLSVGADVARAVEAPPPQVQEMTKQGGMTFGSADNVSLTAPEVKVCTL
jgi:hypothetical protein